MSCKRYPHPRICSLLLHHPNDDDKHYHIDDDDDDDNDDDDDDDDDGDDGDNECIHPQAQSRDLLRLSEETSR